MTINPLNLVKAAATPPTAGTGQTGDTSSAGGSFANILGGIVNQAVSAQTEAQNLSTAAAEGQNVPLQDVVQALGRAELTLQTLVTVRDKAIEAYQEILRMPV